MKAMPRVGRLMLTVIGGAALATGSYALTGTSSVPGSRSGTATVAATLAQKTPTECASMTLTNLVTGTGTFSGTSAADLVLAGAGVDSPSGAQGSDCILGGGSNDVINGGGGTDVCIGGPGVDTFSGCETQIQ